MRIEKKSWPDTFQAILEGGKNFDVRLADFECKPGDILVLREWDPKTKKYTGRTIEKKAKYVLKLKNLPYWTKETIDRFGYQVIGLE